jgi:beta-fructofuranosidase
VSLWHHGPGGAFPLAGVRYLVGDLTVSRDGPRFTPTSGGRLDEGPCFYAPHVLHHCGRTLMWAWSWERGRDAQQIARAGWAGSLTFVRDLRLDGGVLASRPAPELDGLRGEPLSVRSGEPFAATAFDCELPPDGGVVSLSLVDAAGDRVVASRRLSPTPMTPPRILVDASMVEVFDGGPTAYTTRAYPTQDSRWIVRLATPGVIRAWRL